MKKTIYVLVMLLSFYSVFSLTATTLGDVNDDGQITIVDALMIARYSVGLNPPGFQPEWADVNCDGKVAIVDGLMVAQYTVGTLSAFCSFEAINFVRGMGIGWNLGNTLEACGDWIDTSSISNFETAWGNPLTTKAMFEGVRDVGFKSARIPVAWSNLMDSDYTINPDLLNRVEEVVNYALSCDMYAIINIHWDGGWIANFSTNYEESMLRYRRFWTRISDRFKGYSDRVVFESLNEEGCWNDIWNRYGGDISTKQQAYDILNTINREFVNIVRNSGGYNGTRYLLIAGYATDIDLTSDPAFKMPEDPVKHSIVSVHYYTPATFTILEEDADWGQMTTTWGTAEDIALLKNDINKLKTRFIENGIPVIIGEYGTTRINKDPESVIKYLTEVATIAYSIPGICPMFWDTGGFFNRETLVFNEPRLADMYRNLADSSGF